MSFKHLFPLLQLTNGISAQHLTGAPLMYSQVAKPSVSSVNSAGANPQVPYVEPQSHKPATEQPPLLEPFVSHDYLADVCASWKKHTS